LGRGLGLLVRQGLRGRGRRRRRAARAGGGRLRLGVGRWRGGDRDDQRLPLADRHVGAEAVPVGQRLGRDVVGPGDGEGGLAAGDLVADRLLAAAGHLRRGRRGAGAVQRGGGDGGDVDRTGPARDRLRRGGD